MKYFAAIENNICKSCLIAGRQDYIYNLNEKTWLECINTDVNYKKYVLKNTGMKYIKVIIIVTSRW